MFPSAKWRWLIVVGLFLNFHYISAQQAHLMLSSVFNQPIDRAQFSDSDQYLLIRSYSNYKLLDLNSGRELALPNWEKGVFDQLSFGRGNEVLHLKDGDTLLIRYNLNNQKAIDSLSVDTYNFFPSMDRCGEHHLELTSRYTTNENAIEFRDIMWCALGRLRKLGQVTGVLDAELEEESQEVFSLSPEGLSRLKFQDGYSDRVWHVDLDSKEGALCYNEKGLWHLFNQTKVILRDPNSGSITLDWSLPAGYTSWQWSKQTGVLAALSSDAQRFILLDIQNNKIIKEVDLGDVVVKFVLAPSGDRVAFISAEGSVFLLDLLGQDEMNVFNSPVSGPIKQDEALIQWSKSSDYVVLQSSAIPFFIWDFRSKVKLELSSHSISPYLELLSCSDQGIRIPLLSSTKQNAEHTNDTMGFLKWELSYPHGRLEMINEEKAKHSAFVLNGLFTNAGKGVNSITVTMNNRQISKGQKNRPKTQLLRADCSGVFRNQSAFYSGYEIFFKGKNDSLWNIVAQFQDSILRVLEFQSNQMLIQLRNKETWWWNSGNLIPLSGVEVDWIMSAGYINGQGKLYLILTDNKPADQERLQSFCYSFSDKGTFIRKMRSKFSLNSHRDIAWNLDFGKLLVIDTNGVKEFFIDKELKKMWEMKNEKYRAYGSAAYIDHGNFLALQSTFFIDIHSANNHELFWRYYTQDEQSFDMSFSNWILGLDEKGDKLFLNCFAGGIHALNWKEKEAVLFPNAGYYYKISDDNQYCWSIKADEVQLWDVETGQLKFHLKPFANGEWLAYDDDYHYDGTPAAREQLYFTCGLEIIELSQLKDALYVPGLVEKIMSGQPILYPKLSELEICGTLPLIEKIEDTPYHYTITPRKLGLKRVEVYVNGKRVMMKSPGELNKKEDHYEWNIEENEIQKFFVPGEENQVKVIGIVQQGNNEMQSRGVVEEVEPTKEEKQHPTFYGLMVGVSDYKDDRLDLKYPTKDSKDLGKVMESAAKKLLNTTTENHVKMYYVNSEVKGENGYATPEREGVKKALQAISKEARAEDVVMIFFAGHGVMEGDKDKRFTFLTAESTKENLVGISTKDLEEWMSGTNGYLPNKTILIFDACNSGQATEELMAMARDDEETQRIRQVEDLKDKSGMFIMSASAANQSAYELPRYGHGLLTYSLLKTLKTSSSTLDEERFINVQKWFLETETTMDNLTRELGVKQEAQPFGRGNIRVGELDEEIRGGIEIQQEKPMVYCANALNVSTTEDDLHLKEYINQTNTRSTEEQYHFVWGSANAFDIEMNIVYEPVENGYEVKVKWRKKQQTLKTLVFIDQNEKNIKDRILLETESILMMNK